MNTQLPTSLALPYSPTALTTQFTTVMHSNWTQLLHSGDSNHPHSRFDILVADPLVTLVTREQYTTITTPYGIQVTAEDPLDLLQQQIATWLPPSVPICPHLPFQGGAIGILSYDLGRRFESIPECALADISHPEMAMGIYDWALIADHHLKKLTLITYSDIQKRCDWLMQMQSIDTSTSVFCITTPWKTNMRREEYAKKFLQIQSHLRHGDCYQINFSQRFSAYYSGDEWQAFQKLTIINRAPFSAFLRFPWGSVLSFSPERFLHLEQDRITTRPIKGTCARHTDPEKDNQAAAALAISVKDRAENLMIVDLLRNDIGRIAQIGSVMVPELFVVEHFPAVHHLVSTVTALLDPNYTPAALLRATFPGGSVTGAPKIKAMALIDTLEPQRRSIYCGSIGYLSCCGTLSTNIVIRTLLAQKGRLYCWTGGAIVADSDLDAERQECLDKIKYITVHI